jgi:hypothetical protein
LTIFRNNVYQVTFDVQAKSTGGAIVNKRVELEIKLSCGAETLIFAKPENDFFDIYK